jgi:acetoacetate decarboxylase
MTKIDDLKGFAFPTPEGKVSVVGDLPWHFGAEHLCVVYRTDPEALAAYLPDPLMPGDPLDRVIVDFGKWYSLWDRSTCRKTTPNVPGTRRPSCGYYFENGCTITGGNVIYCWVKRCPSGGFRICCCVYLS